MKQQFFLNNYCNANFKMEGGFDSTTSHITARKANKVITTIEAKFASTQAGQIVLQKDGNKFYFCDKSKNDSNVHTDKIINYLNKNHSSFEGVKTASIHVNIDESILFSWVKTNL